MDLFGAYPIMSGYEPDCNYSNAENGDYCDGGYLRDRQGNYKLDLAGILCRCPKCGNKRTIGPGSFVEIPIPRDEDGNKQPDLRNPVQLLHVDRDSLDYNAEEVSRLKTEIINAVVGQSEEIAARDAINEQQVQAIFESQSTILNRIKTGFESAQKWVDDTICKLRYGNYFVSSYVNYGTDFFISTANELRAKYQSAKQAGASESELDAMQQQIIDTEYRNNPNAQRRMKLLFELEPYPHLTVKELSELQAIGAISNDELRIKLNFSNFVRRFERENTDLLEFGAAIPFNQRVEKIKTELLRYAKEIDETSKTE